jgi:hypothetical protein
MRTIKALACAAALAAGLATSLADSSNVYSLNVVGYYNVVTPANTFAMIANQLNTTNNSIGALLPNGPPGANFYKMVNGNFETYTFDPDDLTWYPNSAVTLNVGEAGVIKTPAATTLTFVGEVLQGSLTFGMPFNQLAARASQVPQAGKFTTDLLFPGQGGDAAYKMDGGNFATFTFDPDDLTWYPTEPTFGVGEGVVIKKAGAATAWTRTFTVN